MKAAAMRWIWEINGRCSALPTRLCIQPRERGLALQYKDIEIFLNLVRTRNISKTAQQLYLSQSTVSNRLKNLEAELDCQLIQRAKGHRTVQLTHQGEAFIPTAERWESLFKETERLRQKAARVLRIAANESTYYEVLAPFLVDLTRRYPWLQLSIQICDSVNVYDLIEKKLIDYGFASYESFREAVSLRCISHQKSCIVRAEAQPGLPVTIHSQQLDLDPAKEIRFTGGHFYTLSAWHEKWLGGQSVCRAEVNSLKAAVPFLREAGCWALCPISSAEQLARETPLQFYYLDNPPEDREIYFLRHRESTLRHTQVEKLFQTELEDYLKDMEPPPEPT